jgi:hypothetical protein
MQKWLLEQTEWYPSSFAPPMLSEKTLMTIVEMIPPEVDNALNARWCDRQYMVSDDLESSKIPKNDVCRRLFSELRDAATQATLDQWEFVSIALIHGTARSRICIPEIFVIGSTSIIISGQRDSTEILPSVLPHRIRSDTTGCGPCSLSMTP